MTNPTMSAEERANSLFGDSNELSLMSLSLGRDKERDAIAEQIRQAEQAAYERAAKVADKAKPVGQHAKHIVHQTAEKIANAIRALAQEPEEVG